MVKNGSKTCSMSRRSSRSRCRSPDADVAAGRASDPRDVVVHVDVAGLDSSVPPSAWRRGRSREVHEYLLHLAGIGEDRPQIVGERGDQVDVLAEGPAQHLSTPEMTG